ncbi:MAG TPA: pitrilysin family protein [Polyangia bacterium]|nr:pitrilysin family protein [Polyangia bacterium]
MKPPIAGVSNRMTRALGGIVALAALDAACATQAPPPAPAAPPVALAPPAPAAVPPPAPAPPPVRATPDAPFRAEAPAPGPEPAFAVPAFKRFKLPNGLEVVLAEFHDLPLIDLNLYVKSGGGANPPEMAGLAEMTANMLDEGTKTRTALQIADQLAVLGAALGTGSSWDASTVTLATLTRNFDAALAIWADVVQNPRFDESEYARVRDNVLAAIARRKDAPPTVASLAMSRVLFGPRHPYGWPLAGVEESLKAIAPADLIKFYRSHYLPNNAVLIVAGDTTEPELRAKLGAALGGWKPGKVPAHKLPPAVLATAPAAPGANKTHVVLIDKAQAPQSSVRVGLVGIERTNPDYIPITVMNLILGGGFYRLDLNLREGKGWTYGARSMFDSRKTPGPFSAGGEFVAAHTAESVGEIMREMNGMRDADVTDAELARAKDQITKSFPARFATRASVAGQLAEIGVYGLPDSYLRDYTRKIMAVTKDDVRRVARKYLDPSRLAVVVVGDEKSLREPLGKFGTVEVRDLDGNPVAMKE